MAKVTFDGDNKLILVNNDITYLNIKDDVYSEWKRWSILIDNSKYPQAMSAIGGDPTTGSEFLGSTFFLENEWKIRPAEWSHELVIEGNLYSRDGLKPVIPTLGNYNVLITLKVSNLVDTVSTTGTSGPTADEIATAILAKTINGITLSDLLQKIDNTTDDTLAISIVNLK